MSDSKKLWTKNFTTIIFASALGCIGNIIGSFALSFLVFEETQSTFAASLNLALRVIPGFFIPLCVSPTLDRIPRKPVLVATDGVASVVYVLAGLWLKSHEFRYIPYLIFSLILASLGSFDELTYNSIYPKLIPEGMEEKGFSVSSMLYPILAVTMTPVAAFLYKHVDVAFILMGQGICSALAAIIENRIDVVEEIKEGTDFSFKQWWGDIKDTAAYLKQERGLFNQTIHTAVNNGFGDGTGTMLVAFFSTTPGFSIAMYSAFTVVEFIGRTVGATILYKTEVPKEKKYGRALFVYFTYNLMDTILLWIPYPFMLINRCICGFLGVQSYTLRYAAIQKYIPESMRSRINAFQSVVCLSFASVQTILVGLLGDILPYKYVFAFTGLTSAIVCLLTIVRTKEDVRKIYTSEGINEN